MTKREAILQSALPLFARAGYDATSTNRIAREAGVSEGLIFRHFGSKEGLLNTLMEEARDRAWQLYRPILAETDPRLALRAILNIPFDIPDAQRLFWHLLFALKWRQEQYDPSLSEPLKSKLKEIFWELGYLYPADEAEVVLTIIDGLAMTLLLRKPENTEGLRKALHNKYLL